LYDSVCFPSDEVGFVGHCVSETTGYFQSTAALEDTVVYILDRIPSLRSTLERTTTTSSTSALTKRPVGALQPLKTKYHSSSLVPPISIPQFSCRTPPLEPQDLHTKFLVTTWISLRPTISSSLVPRTSSPRLLLATSSLARQCDHKSKISLAL